MDISQTVRAARLLAGLTLQQVEESSGIDRSYICNVEKGHRGNLKIDTLEKIAEALGCRLELAFVPRRRE